MRKALYVIRCGIVVITLVLGLVFVNTERPDLTDNLKAAVLATLAASMLFVRFRPDELIGRLLVWATGGLLAWQSGWHWIKAAGDVSPSGLVLYLAMWSGFVILAGYFLGIRISMRNDGDGKGDMD